MSFRWIKRYMPHSLYARAALILLLPVITLLVVVSVVSAQRLFESVARQMTISAAREIRLVLTDPSAELRLQTLQIAVKPVDTEDVPKSDYRRWFDFSGIVVTREFKTLLPGVLAVVLPDDHYVHLYVARGDGHLQLIFDRRRVSVSNPHQLFVNMVVFGALMTLVAYLYLRNQLRPIKRLSRAAEAFGRGRHVAYKPQGAHEVRTAGHAFLDMRARIERQIEQRTLMLSGVSHDLRTPLTRLRLSLSMLDGEEDRDPMLRDVRDMERMLEEFLAFARNTAEGDAKPVDPVALVTQIVQDCGRSNIPATLHEVSGEGTVMLREVGIRRAIENLINNAVRYGSRAELSIKFTERFLRIRVEDDGPGIPEGQRGEATKPFTRLEPARNQDKGTGVGLGLAITTDIARAHGGSLRLGKSKRLGGLSVDIVLAR